MLIDVHTHIFPPDIITGRELFFAAEPEFQLLYGPAASKMASAEELVRSMDENGIDLSVVFGFPWRNTEILARHNAYVIEAAARFPGRLIPMACLDLLSGACAQEAEKMITAGARGLGELAVYSAGGNMDRVFDNFKQIAALCREKEVALLVHANEPVGHQYPGKAPYGLDFYYGMAKAAAGATLIFAHWGGGLIFFELLKKQAPAEFANIFYDTAASPYVYRTEIYRAAAQAVGAGRILFGSDYPLLSPKRYFAEMNQSGLTQPDINSICGENAARLFHINKEVDRLS
ncbi:MAG: amidohydrolase family protein [Deltaproteobacteria bacterium]|nr:amidohydrolase family protein [Deltaproteobacteria bacterium]